MEAHSLNTTDAALLILFQAYIQTFAPVTGQSFLLVAADERLVRSAQAEGLRALNPDSLSVTDVLAFLASLLPAFEPRAGAHLVGAFA